jgi:hypothetical protein
VIPAAVTAGLLLALGGLTAAAVAFTPKRPGSTEQVQAGYTPTDSGVPTDRERETIPPPTTLPTQPQAPPSTQATQPKEPESSPAQQDIPKQMPPPDPVATGDAPGRSEVKAGGGEGVTVAKRPPTAVEEGDAPTGVGAKVTPPPDGLGGRVKPPPAKWDLDLLARLSLDDKKPGMIATLKGVCGADIDGIWGATFVGDGRGLVCVTRGIDADDLKNHPKVNAAITPATIQLWDVAAEQRVHKTRLSLTTS